MDITSHTELKTFCADLHSTPDADEVLECIDNGESDFFVNNVRFIDTAHIDKILAEELSSCEYSLGCFMSGFIADQTDLDVDVIQTLQTAEAFEALGKLIIKMCDMEEYARAYASADGYGHHFNSYDFGQEEITINDIDYLVFDNH